MFKKMSIFSQLMLSFVLLISFLSVIFTIYHTYREINSLNKNIDYQITLIGSSISQDPRTLESLETNHLVPSLDAYLDTLVNSNTYDFDLIVLVNTSNIRLYHPIESEIGKSFVGGDETPILNGQNPYISEATGGTGKLQRRYFHGVYDENNQPLGFIMVSAYKTTIANLQKSIWIHTVLVFILFNILGALISLLVSNRIKKSLLGNEPFQIAQLYLQKDKVLNALNEGILLINQSFDYIYANDAAKAMIDDMRSDNVDINHFIKKDVVPLIKLGNRYKNKTVRIGHIDVLIHTIPLVRGHDETGTIITLQNKSELVTTAEELTGVKHLMEALRATTHEHKNKLHVILGLLQLNDTKRAIRYIQELSDTSNKSRDLILSRIKNKTIAALIIGKMHRAAEINLTLILDDKSYLDTHNQFLSTPDLVTVIGNLLENSFDAFSETSIKNQIILSIISSTESLIISVSDEGMGISPDILANIFDANVSSKGAGRGVGMSLIKSIIDKRAGHIDIQTSLKGTTIEIIIKNKRTAYLKGDKND